MSRNRKNEKTALEKKRKKLKVWGTFILIASFASQNLLLSYYISKVDDNFISYQAYSNSYNSALIYESIFFSQKVATDVADGEVLKAAARDNFAGFGIRIAKSELTKKEKKDKLSKILIAQERVTNLETYNEFKTILNQVEGDFLKKTIGDYTKLVRYKNYATYLYIALYILGTLLLLRSIKDE